MDKELENRIVESQLKDAPLIKQQESANHELTQWQLSPLDIFDSIEHNLKGEVFNPATNAWEQRGLRLMNDNGIRAVITHLIAGNSKIIYMSNLSEEEVNKMAYGVMSNLGTILGINLRQFEIDQSNFFTVLTLVGNTVFAGLKRAMNGEERRGLTSTRMVREVITSGTDEDKKKKSLFNLTGG